MFAASRQLPSPTMPIYTSLIHYHVYLPTTHAQNVPLPCTLADIVSHQSDFQFRRGTSSGLTAFTVLALGVWAGCAGASGMGTSEKSSWEMALIVYASAPGLAPGSINYHLMFKYRAVRMSWVMQM